VAQKANSSFKNRFHYTSVIDEASDVKFGMQLGFAKAHHQIPLEKTGRGPGLGEFPEISGFPFNITATAEASDVKFSTRLGFAKAHHKITPRGKSECGLRLEELPNILEFFCNISAAAGTSDFKFGTQLGFAKAHHKITRRIKAGHGPGLVELAKIWGSPLIFTQWLKLATLNFVHSLCLPRPTIK